MNKINSKIQLPYISILAHSSPIQSIACLENKSILTYSQQENEMKIWVIKPSKEYALLKTISFNYLITAIMKLNHNKLLIGTKEKLIILDLITYQCITTIIEGVDWVESLLQLSDRRIVSGSTSIFFFDSFSYKFLAKLNESKQFCYSLIQLRDNRLVGGLFDSLIKVWDVNLLKRLQILKGHFFAIHCLVELKNSNLASGSWDMIVKIWEMKEYKCLFTLSGHNGTIMCMIQLKDERLVACSSDKCLKVYDAHNEYNSISVDIDSYIIESIEQSDDEMIYLGGSDGALHITKDF